MGLLNDIGLKHNTDKATFHKYLDFYQKHLPKRSFKGRLLEIGVMDGASLKMWREYYPNAEIIGIDIKDTSAYDVIILLAANLGHDMQMFQDNLVIYRWACKQKAAHIIYTSSAAVYSDNNAAHVETDPTPAPTIYGRSKLLGEQLISQACPNRTILRLANVYGNGDGNGAIDIFKRGGNKIYGTGEDVRDYIHVSVVAEAIKRIALNPAKYNKEIFNISSFLPITTNEAYLKFGNEGMPADYLPPRGFDVSYSLLWNKKAKDAGLIDEN